MSYLVIVPSFNHGPHLPELVGQIRSSVPSCGLLVVDDGSTDGTGRILASLGVESLRYETNHGKGEALAAGYQEGLRRGVDAIIQLDADLQHESSAVPQFISAFEQKLGEIIVGRRNLRDPAMPWPRRLSNTITSRVVSHLAGAFIPDSQCGFRLIGRRALELISPQTRHFEFESEFLILAGRAGLAIGSCPIATRYAGETSAMKGWLDTGRFVRMAMRYQFKFRHPGKLQASATQPLLA